MILNEMPGSYTCIVVSRTMCATSTQMFGQLRTIMNVHEVFLTDRPSENISRALSFRRFAVVCLQSLNLR